MKNSIKLNGVDLPREKMVSLDEDRLQSLDFTVYGEPTFVILGYSDGHFLCKVSCSGELIEKVEEDTQTIHEIAFEESHPALAQACRSFLDYNSHNDVLAAATQPGEVNEATKTIMATDVNHDQPILKFSFDSV